MFFTPEQEPVRPNTLFRKLLEERRISLPAGQSLYRSLEQINDNQTFTKRLLKCGGVITSLGDYDLKPVVSPDEILSDFANADRIPLVKTCHGGQDIWFDVVSPSTPSKKTEITVISSDAHYRLTYSDNHSFWFVALEGEKYISMFGEQVVRNLGITLQKRARKNGLVIPPNTDITRAILTNIAHDSGYGYTPTSELRRNFVFLNN